MMKRFSLRFDMDKENEASAYQKLINESEKMGVSQNAYIISILNTDLKDDKPADNRMVPLIVDGVVQGLQQAFKKINSVITSNCESDVEANGNSISNLETKTQKSDESQTQESEETVSDEMANFMFSFQKEKS